MAFPITRLRRLRKTPFLRSLVRETTITMNDIMAPLFVLPGSSVRNPISSLEGHFHLSPDEAVREATNLMEIGVKSLMLFGLPDRKDATGSSACNDDGVVQETIRELKRELPEMIIAADLCFCEYTDHGHCGVIVDGDVDNDLTLKETAKQALSLARAGADIIAPSGMMDGMVSTIRRALDENGFKNTLILSYAAKFASAYYGPFREAANSAPSFGDRSSYQMDPANKREALRELMEDFEEGADMLMVKPALAYLDIISEAKESFLCPIAAYNVSGEYAMIKSASKAGLIDGERVMAETLLSIKRAGADIIITYFAKDLHKFLQNSRS